MSLLNPFEYISKDKEQESYIEELIKKIKSDREFFESLNKYELDETGLHDNINMINQYYEDKKYCEYCPGLAKCAKENAGYTMSINKINNKFLQSNFSPCQKTLEEMQYTRSFIYRDFKEEYEDISLEDVELKTNRKRVFLVQEFSKILEGESSRWLYLLGNNGVGKTYVAVALANTFVRLGHGNAAVLDSSKRIKELSSLSRKNSAQFDEVMEELSNVDLLILDDLGNEYKSEYVRDMIVIPLLNERVKLNKVTIITSEFSIEDLATLYSIGDRAGQIKGKQLLNILRSACEKEFDLSGVNFFKK